MFKRIKGIWWRDFCSGHGPVQKAMSSTINIKEIAHSSLRTDGARVMSDLFRLRGLVFGFFDFDRKPTKEDYFDDLESRLTDNRNNRSTSPLLGEHSPDRL